MENFIGECAQNGKTILYAVAVHIPVLFVCFHVYNSKDLVIVHLPSGGGCILGHLLGTGTSHTVQGFDKGSLMSVNIVYSPVVITSLRTCC